MKAKIIFMTLLAVAGTIAGVLFSSRQLAEQLPAQPTAAPAKIETASVAVATEKTTVSAPEKITEVSVAQKNSTAASIKKQKSGKTPKPKEPLHDPAARAALGLVGADPLAEQYWLAAISDPALPDQEREDLMEDLNEDGLSDPKHPGSEDVPLILNRLALIEDIAPHADDFMREHLGEAYKDLNNLLAGKPVQ